MLFNSAIFLFAFLPVTLLGWYGLNHFGLNRAALCFLSAASLVFYGYFKPSYLILIFGSIVINFALMKAIIKFKKAAKILLFSGISANIILIGIFKYLDFIISIANDTLHTDQPFFNILLPLGISFYTLQQIAGLVDAYRGDAKNYSFTEYLAFVAFFPQLVAGPIVLSDELIPQFRDKKCRSFNYDRFAQGLCRFIIGLSKKVLIADMFGHIVDFGFEKVYWIDTASAWIVAVCYSVQLYFDFSGYSDMAIGLGAMFNLEIPVNFNSPYKALSISDFWKRWHMTLTRFLTRYIYIPLGGNRKGKVRTYINVMTVFLVSGIWHGANWTFILWGVLHGGFQCINKLFSSAWSGMLKALEKSMIGRCISFAVKICQWLVTFVIINLLWLLFRADSVKQYLEILKRLTVPYYDIREELLDIFRIPKIRYVVDALHLEMGDDLVLRLCMYAAMALVLCLCLFVRNNHEREIKRDNISLLFTWGLLFICIISMGQVSTFLYFNF